MTSTESKKSPKLESTSPKLTEEEKSKIAEEENSRKVFVGNLSFNLNASKLKAEFEKVGEVDYATIISFRGYSKGYGFVIFKDKKSVEPAVKEFNDKDIDGRVINCAAAKSPEEMGRTSSRGRGRGRGNARSNPADKNNTEAKPSLLKPRTTDDFDEANVENSKEEEYEDEDQRIDDQNARGRSGRGRSSRGRRGRRGGRTRGTSKPRLSKSDLTSKEVEETPANENEENTSKPKPRRPFSRGRYNRFRGRRTSRPAPEDRAKLTVYIANLPFSILNSEQFSAIIPSPFKEEIEHTKIAKKAFINSKVSSNKNEEEEVKLLSKGFGFIQFKTEKITTEFLQKYGSKDKDETGEPLSIEERNLWIVRANTELVSEEAADEN